ncbi:GNAT family N-acetyltransferase [Paracoccus aerodenitrificans]|uniref:GNAT family N-acetyltransferase n=1 Tax=Paracoccus aerodenitrificans TaxID=3017781 RepID=UPI0022EFFE38|nr:N-acetyltransferase [Paracoccus aerodenitrificans]WBU63300.1 N-acetyltransferase [Paracoccus aerodenitrificans]
MSSTCRFRLDIRPEIPGDEGAISALTEAAFKPVAHSSGTEARIIEELRDAGALILSLVAVGDGRITGHLGFSPVQISKEDCGWIGLGPVSVSPGHQKAGIGSTLIRDGLSRMQDAGYAGCVLLGDPAYYGRFGFRHDPALVYPGVPPEYFMALHWSGPARHGEVAYHPAFRS